MAEQATYLDVLSDVVFHWHGDNQHWDLLCELQSGSGHTLSLEDGESITVARRGETMKVTRNNADPR